MIFKTAELYCSLPHLQRYYLCISLFQIFSFFCGSQKRWYLKKGLEDKGDNWEFAWILLPPFPSLIFFSHLVGNTAERNFPEQLVEGSQGGLAVWRGRAFQVYWVAQCVPAWADTLGWSTVVADGSFLLVFWSTFSSNHSPSVGSFSYICMIWPHVVGVSYYCFK